MALSWLRRRSIRVGVAGILSLALAMPAPLAVHAANHPLSAVPNPSTVDYVVNTDWDYDAPPAQNGNPDQLLDRAYLRSVIRVVAQSVYTMTEGRHRLGTVFVYRNKLFGNNVDIQFINRPGRSSAHVAGWGTRDMSSFNHLAFEGQAESVDALGKVVAHELGHYTYGLYDEYVEEGKALDPDNPGSPSGVDTPKDTIMNSHLQFLSLSTPTDYSNPAQRRTAQSRMFATNADGSGGSAWEVLTRRPDRDPEQARNAGRTFFEAFAGIDPSTLRLTRPVQGFDAALNIVFVPNPVFRDVIVVDRSLPKARFDQLIQAAVAMVAKAPAGMQFAIVAGPATGDGPELGFTPTTAAGKASLTETLQALEPEAGATFDSLGAFTSAYRLIAAARQPGDPATVHLMTGAEAAVPAEVVSSARLARVAVNPLGLTGGLPQGLAAAKRGSRDKALKQSASGQASSLAALARATGGSYNAARNGTEAAKDATRALNETLANSYALLHFDGNDRLAAGQTFETSFRMASGATDGDVDVEIFFDPQDTAKLRFALVSPTGAVYQPGSLPAGIGYEIDDEEGVAAFTIAAGFANRAGQWRVRATASALVAEGVGVDVSSNARIRLAGELLGGAADSATKPVLQVALAGDKRIRGAQVTADIYDEEGNLKLAGLVLRDDGKGVDAAAGDGLYSADLSGKLPAGIYFALVSAATNAESRIASLGALIKGARDEELPVELLVRLAEVEFELVAEAPGVGIGQTPSTPTTTTSASSGGGGCAVSPQGGNDAGLVLLLLAGLLGLALRRRAAWLATRR
jgi:hypothetical protein